MITMIIMLTLGQVALELYVNRAFPNTIGKWQMNYKWFNIGFSLVFSFLLGIMFPAIGFMVFSAAVLSTVITQPYYAIRRQYRNGIESFKIKGQGTKTTPEIVDVPARGDNIHTRIATWRYMITGR